MNITIAPLTGYNLYFTHSVVIPFIRYQSRHVDSTFVPLFVYEPEPSVKKLVNQE